jgi:hypothetical protein
MKCKMGGACSLYFVGYALESGLIKKCNVLSKIIGAGVGNIPLLFRETVKRGYTTPQLSVCNWCSYNVFQWGRTPLGTETSAGQPGTYVPRMVMSGPTFVLRRTKVTYWIQKKNKKYIK